MDNANAPRGLRRMRLCAGCGLKFPTYEHVVPPITIEADPLGDLESAFQNLERSPAGPQRRNSLNKCKVALRAVRFLLEGSWSSSVESSPSSPPAEETT